MQLRSEMPSDIARCSASNCHVLALLEQCDEVAGDGDLCGTVEWSVGGVGD
jgi:hypothetical protein